MTTNKGYPLPEDLEPENDRCFVVYVPDAPEYVRAFFGSITGLAKWNVWERTGNSDGATAAQRWKRANLRTIAAEKVVDCAFLEELLEDGDMSVNVTNNVSCGQCGGSGCGCEVNIPPNPIDVPEPVQTELPNLPTQSDDGQGFPDGFADRTEYLEHKCRAARELARDIVQTLGNLGSFSGILAALGAYAFGLLITAPASGLVASALLPLIGLGLSPAAAIAIVGSALLILIVSSTGLLVYFNTLQASLAAQLDDLTCLLYTAGNGAEARAAVIQFINEDVTDLVFDDASDKELFSRSVESILGAILAPKIFLILFATGTAITEWLTERDDGFNCEDCLPPTLGGWIWSYSSGYSGESIVTVTLNNVTDFHANGQIHKGSQFGAYEFRVIHPLDAAVTRVEFSYTKVSGDATRIRMGGTNVFSNAQTGTYLIAETTQPDAGNFDFVATRSIPEDITFDFSSPYNSSAPRPFDWQIDDFLATI